MLLLLPMAVAFPSRSLSYISLAQVMTLLKQRPMFSQRCLIAVIAVCLALLTAESMAGHFRRYPRIANGAKADGVGGLEKSADGLPPKPPRDPGEPADKPETSDGAGSDKGEGFETQDEPEGEADDDEEPRSEFEQFLDQFRGNEWIKLEYVYTGDSFSNVRGGLNSNSNFSYRGNLDITLTADLNHLESGPGGTFFLYFEQNHGRGPTRFDTGDFQFITNIDTQDFTNIQELWWDREVFDDFMRVRLGKIDGSADFGVCDLGGDFINASYGITPTLGFLPQYPYTTFGAITYWQLTEQLELRVGVFNNAGPIEVLPQPTRRYFGASNGYAFTVAQLTSRHEIADLPGDVHGGVWYDGSPYASLADGIERKGNHGAFVGLDQMIWRENPEDDEDNQGLGLFAHYGWNPQDINLLRYHVGAGVVYRGLIDCRDGDTAGIGVERVEFSRYLVDQGAETAFELFYKAPINDHLTLQPDIQYVASPSGMYRDALLFGLRFELVL